MILVKRKKGSSRASLPTKVELEYNWAGQGGSEGITFVVGDTYYRFIPEDMEDVKKLMSCAHIIHHNFKD